MAIRLLKIAVIYMMIGVVMGLVMGITHRFQYAPVHAHINLLGWASLALISLIYHVYPEAAQTKLAQLHFWLHNIGVPVFMVSLFFLLSGHPLASRGVAIGGIATLIGIQMFAINLLRTLRTRNVAKNPPLEPSRPGVRPFELMQAMTRNNLK
jgi:cbb3-type cytochrome oxidase subunit 1